MSEDIIYQLMVYKNPDLTHVPKEERIEIRKRVKEQEEELKKYYKCIQYVNTNLDTSYDRICHIDNICAERKYTIINLIDEILEQISDDEIREIIYNIEMRPPIEE